MKSNKILSVIISAIIAFAAPIAFCNLYQNYGNLTAIAVIDENKTYDSWQKAYKAVLADNRGDDRAFEIFDINQDGIPELFISMASYGYKVPCQIYAFIDNKPVQIISVGNYGYTYIDLTHNYIIGGSSHMGYNTEYYYSFDGREAKLVKSFVENNYEDTPVYEVDDVEVTESEYKNAHKPYDSITISERIGREHSFDDLYCKVGDIYYDYFFDYYMAWFLSTESTVSTITIPSKVNGLPVTAISNIFLIDNSTLRTLNLPASIDSFYYNAFSEGHVLTAINIDLANPYYASKDGVMYNKDMTKLVKFPTARDASNYTFPQSVTEVGRYAFSWCTGTKNIVIPETIDTINEGAFYSCPNLSSITIMNPECSFYDYWNDGDGITICNTYDDTTEKGNYLGVIRGYDNSTAQKYADNFGRTFISLGSFIKYGDCNNDGYVNIADAVMLQKYLLGNGSLTNWKNADLFKDDRIDVFDMVLMRKLLIENN